MPTFAPDGTRELRGIVHELADGPTLFGLIRAESYDLPIAPGANLLPFTGADRWPVEIAFGKLLTRMQIVWRWDDPTMQ